MIYSIILFLGGCLVGFMVSLFVLLYCVRSIENFLNKLTHKLRSDNANYMAESLEDFKSKLTEEIISFQENIQKEIDEEDEYLPNKKSKNNILN